MGKQSHQMRKITRRKVRSTPLSEEERTRLNKATYEGSPYHKRNAGDFGLTPPAAPRPDATLCDEANVHSLKAAKKLFEKGIERELVSKATTHGGYPKQIWIVDDGEVFEAMHGGSHDGCYHGYPIRRSDPLHDKIREEWDR